MMDCAIYKLKPFRTLMQNSLWNNDYYPDLPDLEAHSSIEMFRHNGPGIVRTIHLTLSNEGPDRDTLLRCVFLKITYNGHDYPSVYVPIGDFFCDSFAGQSIPFSGILMAKRPTNSWFSYIPMPFEQSIVMELVNISEFKVRGYGYVTAEQRQWQSDDAYFHAKWFHDTVRLPAEKVPLLDVEGSGHFLGCHLTAVSACPHFAKNQGICEGNGELFIDGDTEPTCNYLGTEDFFGFSWSWCNLWADSHAGTTYLNDNGGVTKLACYRFLINDPIRFTKSLKSRINYQYEWKNPHLNDAKAENNGDVEFGIVVYWYQNNAIAVPNDF